MKNSLILACLLAISCLAHKLLAQPAVGGDTLKRGVRHGQLIVPYNSIEEAITLDPLQSSRAMRLQWQPDPIVEGSGWAFQAQAVLPDTWADQEKLLYIYFPKTGFTLEVNGERVEIRHPGVSTSVSLTTMLKGAGTLKIRIAARGEALEEVEQVAQQFLVVARPLLRSESHYLSVYHKFRNLYRPLLWAVGTDVVNHTGLALRKKDLWREYYTSIYQKKQTLYHDTLNNQVIPLTSFYWAIYHGKGIYDYFWTAETPNLITSAHLQVASSRAYQAREALGVRVGVRLAEVKEGQLMINNVPLNLRPVAYRHPGIRQAAPDKDSLQAYVVKLKRHNVNTILVSGLPANRDLYDLADRYGLYMIQEVGNGGDPVADPGHWVLQQQSMMFLLCNSPSVIAWQVDAEDKRSALVQALTDSIQHINRPWSGKRLRLQAPLLSRRPANQPVTVPMLEELSAEGLKNLKKAYQPIDLWVVDDTKQRITIRNGFDFASLDGLMLHWQIFDGTTLLKKGDMKVLWVLSGKVASLNLPFKFSDYKSDRIQFRFSIRLASDVAWAATGHEVAQEQFSYRATGPAGILKLQKVTE